MELIRKFQNINKNDANLESTDLIIEYPEGAQFQGSSLFGSLRERKSIGTINAHKTYEDDIPLALFGQEGDRKEVKVTLEYRVVGSNAIFVASKNYAVFITAGNFRFSFIIRFRVTLIWHQKVFLSAHYKLMRCFQIEHYL